MYHSAINHMARRAVLDGAALDTAIDEARAELAALLRAPGGGEPSRLTEARALLGSLLDRRVGLAAARLDDRDAFAIAAARADRNEAIAVTGALLYWLPAGDAAWPEVALALGRLSYDRYTDPWPGAEPPDPDDLDAACDRPAHRVSGHPRLISGHPGAPSQLAAASRFGNPAIRRPAPAPSRPQGRFCQRREA